MGGEGGLGGIDGAASARTALDVIANVKGQDRRDRPGLPAGAEIVPEMTAPGLIERAIGNLKWTLLEESLIVAIIASFSCSTCAARR